MNRWVAGAWAAWVLWCAAPWRRPTRRLGPPTAHRRVRRRRAAGGLAGVALVAWVGGLWLAAAAVGSVCLWRPARRRHARRRRERAAAAVVPDLAELLRIGVAAGLTPVMALEQLADLAPPPGRQAARAVLDAAGHGRPLADALGSLVAHLGPTARPLADALAATDRYGVALEPALEGAVAELRRQRRTAAAAAARRLPVSLSFPLVGCVLPAFALLTLAPLVAGAFGSLRAPPSSSPAAVSSPARVSRPRFGPTGPAVPTAPGGSDATVPDPNQDPDPNHGLDPSAGPDATAGGAARAP